MTRHTIKSSQDMITFGREFSMTITPPLIVFLEGDLGAGKTTWMKGALVGLGVTDKVLSPTYPLIRHYRVNQTQIVHLDLYRLSDTEDFLSAGLGDEVAAADLVFIEWPSTCLATLPKPDITLSFYIRHNTHIVEIAAKID